MGAPPGHSEQLLTTRDILRHCLAILVHFTSTSCAPIALNHQPTIKQCSLGQLGVEIGAPVATFQLYRVR